MMGKHRMALEIDLKLLAEQELTKGRMALIVTAQEIADQLDMKPSTALYGKFLEALRGLGIGSVDKYEPEDDFDKFLEELSKNDG